MSKGQGLSFKLKLKKSSKVVSITGITEGQYRVLNAFTCHKELHTSLLVDIVYEGVKRRPNSMSNGVLYIIKAINNKLEKAGYDVRIVGHNQGCKGKFYWVE